MLDNLEQLLRGAPSSPSCSRRAPRLRILATSRAPLRLSGEHDYPVPPLPLPARGAPFEELRRNDAVRLFAARARASSIRLRARRRERARAWPRSAAGSTGFRSRSSSPPRGRQPLAGGAARAARPPPELLGGGPRDAPARQRTLAATIGWSYDLARPRRTRRVRAPGRLRRRVHARGRRARRRRRLRRARRARRPQPPPRGRRRPASRCSRPSAATRSRCSTSGRRRRAPTPRRMAGGAGGGGRSRPAGGPQHRSLARQGRA